jgi:hypothetical protein
LIAQKSCATLTKQERAELERLQRIRHEAMERQFPRLTPEELAEVKKALGFPAQARGQ